MHVCGINFQAAVSSIWARNSVNTALSQRYYYKESLIKTEAKRVFLQEFKVYASSTFVYEPILMQIYMNANLMKTQFLNLTMT